MKIVFFGSSEFAVESLKALNEKHQVVAVFTQPDRKKGRNLKLTPTPVKRFARENSLAVFSPEDVNESLLELKSFEADLFVVVSFGQKLSPELLDAPRLFCVNVHSSLLPRWRGAAPINWALISQDAQTGVSIMKMNEKMDAGDVVFSRSVKIFPEDDAVTLNNRLAGLGAEALLEAVELILAGNAKFKPQDKAKVTVARKLKKEDGLIVWKNSAAKIDAQVRGLLPWPCAFTFYKGKFLKVLKTGYCKELPGEPGASGIGRIAAVLKKDGIAVETGEGFLLLKEVQPEGKKAMPAYSFALGHHVKAGDRFGK